LTLQFKLMASSQSN